MKEKYLLSVTAGIELNMFGPYKTYKKRDKAAEEIVKGQVPEYDSIFWLDRITHEEELLIQLKSLLRVCELNLDELEPETVEQIAKANALIERCNDELAEVEVGEFAAGAFREYEKYGEG